MAKKTTIDFQAAHKYFSTKCFNQAWEWIDKAERNKADDDKMLQLSLASLWHWSQREDATPTNFSIGYWQVSRVFALLRQGENARHYGELCLEITQEEGLESFYRGYAYEALARAAMVAGNKDEMDKNLLEAQYIASTLPDAEEKEQLLKDLTTIH